MSIRPAEASDLEGIARVLVASWHGTYRGLVPDALLERMTVETRMRQWADVFDRPPARSAVLVAESDAGRIVGMAAVGPVCTDDLDPMTVGEVTAIYVEPAAWGRGHGRELMIAGLDFLRSREFTEAALWVLDANERGRSFYERGGWRLDGATQVDTSFGEPLKEVRYRIDIGSDDRFEGG